MFSSHCGAPSDRPLLDSDPCLFEQHKNQKSPSEEMQTVGIPIAEDVEQIYC